MAAFKLMFETSTEEEKDKFRLLAHLHETLSSEEFARVHADLVKQVAALVPEPSSVPRPLFGGDKCAALEPSSAPTAFFVDDAPDVSEATCGEVDDGDWLGCVVHAAADERGQR